MKRRLPRTLQKRPVRAPQAWREAALRRTAAAAARRYGHVRHVLAVAAGWKYRDGRRSDELAVQFFVDSKRKRPRDRLPRYVYARRRDDSIDRSRCFVTDVLEVGRFEFACGGGSRVDALGETGTLTLLFRNRAARSPAWYLLTSAHVAGDLRESPPVDDELDSGDCAASEPFARVVKNEVTRGRAIRYDVALARLTKAAVGELGPRRLGRIDGRVDAGGPRLTGFVSGGEIGPSLEVVWVGARSGETRATVTTFELSADVVMDGREIRVPHLYTLDSAARPGDSGGLVYAGDRAVGIVVARSPSGFCWFQPLEAAVRHVASLDPAANLRCFS